MANFKIFNKETYEKVSKFNKNILKDYTLEMKSNGKSEGTIYQYSADIKMFFCWVYDNLDNMSVLEMKKRQFRNFFLELQDTDVSPARLNRVQCSIRNMLEFCYQDDEEYDYPNNVMRAIKGLEKNAVRDIHFLSDEQITVIIDYLLEKKDYQKALYLSLSYDSAARRNEVFQIKKNVFINDPEAKFTNTLRAKRGKTYEAIILSRSREIAKLLLEQRKDDNVESLWTVGDKENIRPASYETLYYWTTTFRNILKEKTGETIDFNPHSFRHSALENYENGSHYGLKELNKKKFDIKVLKVLANHTSTDTTESYLKNKDEELLKESFGI